MGVFEKKSCFVIAGASRGLGRSIAINFAKKARKESIMILLSRDTKALKEVETEIRSCCQDVNIVVSGFDQGDLDERKFHNIFENIFKENKLSIDSFEQAVIVHNAGTLGDNSKYVKDLVNVSELNTHFGVNLTGNILLNSACLNFFTQERFAHRYVINISSLTAIRAFKSFSLYCTVKAARDMFYKVMAEEEPNIRVLSYAPGPCETDMQIKCRENTSDPEVKQMFESMHNEGNVLECDTSIQKLVQILETDTFVSGAHIDYYDL
ncbi:sepiapterin reductase-like [Mytilus californianus]|uniref:sepiapterin reductase-like n=1 Tax=Mytilus californianus TaxID=6549 RepID=UPI002247DCF9|nr:sepiapterin reductase-like [Mytilus californianus]XP_052091836.1 sepiapterin reductase-like [Mytilus californianus]